MTPQGRNGVLAAAVSGALYAFAALASAPALGQTPAAPAAQQQGPLEEIIVTARYREEKLQETPIAITAIPAIELENRAFHDAFEVGYTVPNASLRPAQQAFGNTMTAYIRGIGQYDFDFAFEPGVGIYIDDVYHPFTLGSEIDLLDLERVEVLRGPQGTLFGRNSIGGAIRYVSKKPVGDNSGYITATVGDFDRLDLRAGYDFTIVEDALFARITGVSKHRDGYQDVIDFACAHPGQAGNLNARSTNRADDCRIGTLGGEDVVGARGILRWVASEAFEATTTVEYTDDTSEARADYISNILPIGAVSLYQANYLAPVLDIQYDERFLTGDPFKTYATFDDPRSGLRFDPKTSFEKWGVSERLDWRITDDVSLATILAYSELDSHFGVDADGSPLNMQTVNGTEQIEVFTGEMRLSGRFWDRVDWTIGGFYYDGSADNDQVVSSPFLSMLLDQFLPNSTGPCFGPFPPCLVNPMTPEEAAALLDSEPETYTFVVAHNLHEVESYAGFAHVEFDLTDRFTFNAGARYSKDEKNVQFDNKRVQNPSVVVEDDRVDWQAGLDFKATGNAMIYASAASGYRPGAYNSRPFQWTQVVAVDAEDAVSYELGLKSDLFDRRLRVNLVGFFIDYAHRILPVGGTECPVLNDPPGPPIYLTVPVGTPGSSLDGLGNNCPTALQISRTFYANGPAEISGVELEATWRPIDELTIQGQVGMLDWQSDDIDNCDFNFDGQPDPGVTCVNDLPPQVPDLNWSVGASYEIALGGGGSFTPRVDVYGQSEICFSPIFENSCVDGYELVNASLMWTSPDRGWTATLGMTNVADEEYFLNSFDLTGFGQPYVSKQPARPQEWFLTVQRNF
jgi:iron complex outermembrane receptor protein